MFKQLLIGYDIYFIFTGFTYRQDHSKERSKEDFEFKLPPFVLITKSI